MAFITIIISYLLPFPQLPEVACNSVAARTAEDEEVMRVGFKEEVALEPGLDCVDMAVGQGAGSAGSGDTQAGKCKVASGSGRCLEGASLKQGGQRESDESNMVAGWGEGVGGREREREGKGTDNITKRETKREGSQDLLTCQGTW